MSRVKTLAVAALLLSTGTAVAGYFDPPSFIEDKSPLTKLLWFLGPGH